MYGPIRIVETDEEKEHILRTELVHGRVFTRKEWDCYVRYVVGPCSILLLAVVVGAIAMLLEPHFPKGRCDVMTLDQMVKDAECAPKILWELLPWR